MSKFPRIQLWRQQSHQLYFLIYLLQICQQRGGRKSCVYSCSFTYHDSLCYMKDSAHVACGGGRVDTQQHRPEEVDTQSVVQSNHFAWINLHIRTFFTFARTFCSFFDRPRRLLLWCFSDGLYLHNNISQREYSNNKTAAVSVSFSFTPIQSGPAKSFWFIHQDTHTVGPRATWICN